MDRINPVFLKSDVQAMQNKVNQAISPSDAQQQFSNILKDAINQVNEYQNISDQKTKGLISGDVENLHEVMIAAQKASVSLQAATQIQSKAIDAYKQVMRMQL